MAKIQGFYIDPSWFEEIDQWIQDNQHIEKNFKFGMDAIVMMYAYVTLAGAQKRSLGPVDPQMRGVRQVGHSFIGTSGGQVTRLPHYSSTAWKIPVRRITGDFFAGWYAKREVLGTWVVGNRSREAYFIEFGINHHGTGVGDSAGNLVRIRRPILKLAVLQAIAVANKTRMDMNAYSKLLGATGIYHSPALYERQSHAEGRSYPLNEGMLDQLTRIAQTGAI